MNQPKIPPELMKQLMQGGFPMPPGMQMPPGMAPPAQRGAPKAPDRRQHNPLPPGQSALRTMKAFAQCPIMEDSDILNKMIEQLLDLEDVEGFTGLTEEAGQAIAIILRSDRTCNRHLSTRVAVKFEDNEELNKTHEDLLAAQKNVERLQKETSDAIQLMQQLVRKRWETAVKNFGLDPEAHFYSIDETVGNIKQMDLKCEECEERTTIRNKRQAVAQRVLELGKLKAEKEKEHDGPGTGDNESRPQENNAGEIRKTSDGKQEI